MTPPEQGVWTRWPPEDTSKLSCSVILWFFTFPDFLTLLSLLCSWVGTHLSSHPLKGQKEPLGTSYPEIVAYHVNRCCADPRASVPSLWIKVADGTGKDILVSKLYTHTQSQILICSLLFACSWVEIRHLAVIFFYWHWFYQGFFVDFYSKLILHLKIFICDGWIPEQRY